MNYVKFLNIVCCLFLNIVAYSSEEHSSTQYCDSMLSLRNRKSSSQKIKEFHQTIKECMSTMGLTSFQDKKALKTCKANARCTQTALHLLKTGHLHDPIIKAGFVDCFKFDQQQYRYVVTSAEEKKRRAIFYLYPYLKSFKSTDELSHKPLGLKEIEKKYSTFDWQILTSPDLYRTENVDNDPRFDFGLRKATHLINEHKKK